MKRLIDKTVLFVETMALAGVCWAILHYAGVWFFAGAALIGVTALAVRNHKLTQTLRKRTEDDPPS